MEKTSEKRREALGERYMDNKKGKEEGEKRKRRGREDRREGENEKENE